MNQNRMGPGDCHVKNSVNGRARLAKQGRQRRMLRVALALMAAGLPAFGDMVRAENECGPPEGEVVCSPSTYDPAEGNIFYSHDEHGRDETSGDFSIRLTEDLSITYDRARPGDDVYVHPDNERRLNGAVWIAPGEFGEYTGDVSLSSSADVTSNAVGIFTGHYGKSGALRMEISGGDFTTMGSLSHAIHGFRSEGSAGALDIVVRGASIDTAGDFAYGIYGEHQGEGELALTARDLTINTAGFVATGIVGRHEGRGDVALTARGLTIDTAGFTATGIVGWHQGKGNVALTARDLAIDTAGDRAAGISSLHDGEGDISLEVRDVAIDAAGEHAVGVLGWHEGKGEVALTTQGLDITMSGDAAAGISGLHLGEGEVALTTRDLAITTSGDEANGILGWHQGSGEVNITAQGVSITTAGDEANGIYGVHQGEGAIGLEVHDVAIDTTGYFANGIYGEHLGKGEVALTARDLAITTSGDFAYGILGWHQGTGEVNITAQGVSITTAGDEANGIYGVHQGEGDIGLEVHDVAIDTAGGNASGVYAEHLGAGALEVDLRGTTIATTGAGTAGVLSEGSGSAHIMIEGGSIHAAGAGASGVRMGQLEEDGTVSLVAPVGEDGYRQQRVAVNAPVTGGSGELAAGVFLAGGGTVAIGPKGRVGAASGVAILASGGAPRLRVEMDLDERRVAEILRGGAIRNDGGETTLLVNGVTLHEGATGATGHTVARGARDLTLRASDTIVGRAFSAQDFTETYAPRAAVYEALPGLLLRLHSRGPAGERLTAPGSPAWVRVAGGGGRYRPVQASVGAGYDYRRVEVEAGLDVAWGPRLTGTLSVRHVQGWGDVTSPTGGGAITAQGLGGALGLAWAGPQGYYFRGRISVMDYDVDLSSDRRGTLSKEASAVGHSLGFETGRRFTVHERLTLTPRVWVTRSKIDLGFTDAVQSRLWAPDADRLTAGTGLVAETERVWDAGAQAFALRGSLDLWRTLGDGTAVQVSQGESLQSVSDKTRVLLSLGGVYRWGRVSVSSEVAAGGPGSRDQEYAGFLNLGVQF